MWFLLVLVMIRLVSFNVLLMIGVFMVVFWFMLWRIVCFVWFVMIGLGMFLIYICVWWFLLWFLFMIGLIV